MDEKVKSRIAEWRKKNPEKVAENQRRYRARKKEEALRLKEEALLRAERVENFKSILHVHMQMYRFIEFTETILQEILEGYILIEDDIGEFRKMTEKYKKIAQKIPKDFQDKFPVLPTFADIAIAKFSEEEKQENR